MDFKFSEEQIEMRERAASFAIKEIAPISDEINRSEVFPEKLLVKLGKAGFLGLGIPREYKGTGADGISRVIAIEEISKVSPSVGMLLMTHTCLGVTPLLLFSGDSLKKHYLPMLASGKMLSAFALSEPAAGSDIGSLQTTAMKKKDAYTLNGRKTFVTLGGLAKVLTVFAKTAVDKGYKGISGFIVQKDTPRVTIGKPHDFPGYENLGIADIFFEEFEVPEENLLGKEGEGFRIALRCIDQGRIGVAAQALGIAQEALDSAVAHALSRQQFGRPLSNMGIIKGKIADIATMIEGARLILYRAAYLQSQGRNFTMEASMAKLSASKAALKAVLESIQIHAGRARFRALPIAKMLEIYGGTSEIQRLVIARNLFKKMSKI